MGEQWLIDGEQLFEFLSEQLVKESGAFSKGVNKGLNIARPAIRNVDAIKPIDPETLPIVRELREKLEQTDRELRNVKYCYDIAKNGERQLRRQVNEVTAEWAECVKKLEQVTAERDAAVRDLYIAKDCNTCALRFTDDCLLEEWMDPCNSFAYGNVPYKWRGSKRLGDGKNGE